MRELDTALICQTVADMVVQANCCIGADVMESLRQGRDREEKPLARSILDKLIRNDEIAARRAMPLCQDTGMDVHELWIDVLPYTLPWRVVYFVVSYLLICFGIALSNRCGLPIVPTDLFPRELADITKVPYPRIKIGFDVTCLAITAGMTFFFLGRLEGLGIGTIAAAFTMGKGIGLVGDLLDKHFYFENYKTLRNAKNKQ